MARRKYFSIQDLVNSKSDEELEAERQLQEMEYDRDDAARAARELPEAPELQCDCPTMAEFNNLKKALKMVVDSMLNPTNYHWDAHNVYHNFEPVFSREQKDKLEEWLH